MRALFVFIILFFQMSNSFAAEKITIDFQHIKTVDAIYYLAKFSQLNVVVNPDIQGEVALHLQHVDPVLALDSLLATQDLMKSKMGAGWFITPRTEFMRHQQDQFKLQEITDESATLSNDLWHVRYAKADDLAHFIQDATNSLLSKRGLVRADARTNILYVQETPERLARIKKIVQQLDVPVQQVLIEARMVIIDHDFERELGLKFGIKTLEDVYFPEPHRYSLAVARLADGSWLDVKLAALEKEGHGELISSPSLLTANQQTASIESGEEIPYQESSRNGATTIAFKKAVLSLKVTPQILPGQQVLLQLQVNQDKPTDRTTVEDHKNSRMIVLKG